MSKALNRIFVFLLSILLSSCAFLNILPQPEISGVLVDEKSASETLQAIKDKGNEISTFRALWNAEVVYHGEIQANFRQAVVFAKPYNIRVETFPYGAFYSLALAVLNKDRATIIDVTSRSVKTGPNGVGAVDEALHVPLFPADLISLATGRMNSSRIDRMLKEKDFELYYDASKMTYFLIEGSNDAIWIINSQNLTLEQAELRYGIFNKLVLRANFMEYSVGDGEVLAPQTIKLFLPDRGMNINLFVKKSNSNFEVSESLFDIKAPGDFKISEF